MKSYVIGIDLGGTKISTALSDLDGNVIAKFILATEASKGEEVVLENIFTSVRNVLVDSKIEKELIETIGIGAPGPLDSKKGIIITTPNLPFKNYRLTEKLENEFGIKTYLDNDANAAAIGEFVLGAGKGTRDMVFVTVSTGVGGGAILDGKVYRGRTSNALEVGHMTVMPEGPICGCGNAGCIEALASGTAIAKRAKEVIDSNAVTSLRKYETITSYEVFKECEAGDKIAKEIIDRAMGYLGIGIANIITAFDPEMVVIGGGVSKAGDIVFDTINKVVQRRNFKVMADSCKIVPAGLGNDAGVMGAVSLAILEAKAQKESLVTI